MADIPGTGKSETLYGTKGADNISGAGGNDELHGNGGADHLDGGSGIDWAVYWGSPVGVAVDLSAGLGYFGHAAGDTLVDIENVHGSPHADLLVGDDDNNTLNAGEGDDTLKGGGGADILIGGGGINTASYDGSPDGVFVSLMTGAVSGGDAEGDQLWSIDNIYGSAYHDDLWGTDWGDNVLWGNNGNDTLKGYGGADTLWGGAGHDTLVGGAGVDTMSGGPGNDTYYVDYQYDVVTESDGQGVDVVFTSGNWAIPAGASIETLRTTDADGTTPLWLLGNFNDNEMIGNDGSNIIDGAGGADHMVGRGGNDQYFVRNANDTVVESGGQGQDEVATIVSWTLTAGADVELLEAIEGYPVANLTGNSSGNEVRGNSGANVINGRGGNDELVGLGGTDAFRFDTALDAASNVDVLPDFDVQDVIHLDNAVFAAFATGPLAAERFVVGAAAQDANDNIIYNDVTGALLYDSDGNGAAAAIQFAQLNPGLGVTNQDFIVV